LLRSFEKRVQLSGYGKEKERGERNLGERLGKVELGRDGVNKV
jgi:hypothetical protein